MPSHIFSKIALFAVVIFSQVFLQCSSKTPDKKLAHKNLAPVSSADGMVYIPAGNYLVGSEDATAKKSEGPENLSLGLTDAINRVYLKTTRFIASISRNN